MNNINGKTKTIGLIGNPVEHTLSPFIHNMLAEKMKLNTVYVPFHVKNGNLKEAISGASALGILGTNVTVPYKVDVMPYIDELQERAKIIDAVNTIKFINGRRYGYNTDADGLLTSCKRAGISLMNKTICILGAGGAARSVAVMCAEEKAKKIIIVNRTVEKAQELKLAILNYFNIEIQVLGYDAIKSQSEVDVCFQTTSIGMYPNSDVTPIDDENFFKGLRWAVDIIYNPSETKFLSLAKASGVSILNGLGMLYFQAVKAYEIWNDIEIPDAILEECLNQFTDYVYSKKR